jgi:transposase-like protein
MNLTDRTFQDDAKARKWLEAQIWPNGPECPHCGNADGGKITALEGKSHRAGLFKCNECREQFTVTVGTVMERSKIPLRKWAMAMFIMAAAKKGVSAHQMHRTMDIPYKTAWFLMHRIREAMKDANIEPLGGSGKIVEADETYFGQLENSTPSPARKGRPFTKGGRSGPSGKRAVVALVERGGQVRMFNPAHVDGVSVNKIVRDNISRESHLMTDESRLYVGVGKEFASHETVTHSHKEYVRGNVHTNTVEGVFSVFKRGMKGTYQHCAEKHLHRYLVEFDFRYNRRAALGVNDTQRASDLAKGALGKRLMYKAATQKI